MIVKDFYPLDFDGSQNSFNSLIRTILIKANYDSVLKKVTGYKGMHQYEDLQECWTLKFDTKEGIYGLLQNRVNSSANDYESSFDLYYFPSPNEKNLQNCSLIEEYIASGNQYIEKVKGFSSFLEMFLNFKIAKIFLNISKDDSSLQITYKVLNKIKTFSKDGIEDINNLTNEKYIIKPNEMDKNFSSLKAILPFFNFFNTLFTRFIKNDPSSFLIKKYKVPAISYNKDGIQSKKSDVLCTKLELQISYTDVQENSRSLEFERDQKNRFFKLLTNGSWFKYKINLNDFEINQSNSLKPRLIVVTGFLGSGKTNFLQNFIEFENQNSRFVGIIQNEIGKTGLDGKLVDYDYNMVEIDEGCVCCSLAGQLRSAIATLFEKKVPDTIILETTGVANPFNLLGEIDELDDLIEFDSIVSIIDAKSYYKLLNSYAVFKDQIRAADVILLNKIDLVDENELQKIEENLHIHNRCVEVIKTVNCSINPLVVTNSAHINNSTGQISNEFNEESTLFRTHLEDNLSSVKKSIDSKLDRREFEEYLQNLPENILRVKGIVEFKGFSSQYVVQYVNGLYEINEIEEIKKENFF